MTVARKRTRLARDAAASAHARWRDEVFGFTFEPAVIVYNKRLVPPEDVPHTRDELADLLRRDSRGLRRPGRHL